MNFLRHFLEGRLPTSPALEEPKKSQSTSSELERALNKDSETENKLTSREVVTRRELGGGFNESEIIELKDDGMAVFKPRDGEDSFADEGYEEGTLYKRERAAYLVSRFLDLGLVPSTVIKKVGSNIGSAQEFVLGTTPAEMSQRDMDSFAKKHNEELVKLWLFDYVIWNTDRHGANLLINGERVVAIDNGLSFVNSRQRWLKTYYNREVIDKNIPSEVVSKFKNFLADAELKKTLSDLLSEHLTKEEVGSCMARIERVGEVVTNKKGQMSEIFKDKYKLDFNPSK